jgi:tetratricopeptide (TPR) repeat protein
MFGSIKKILGVSKTETANDPKSLSSDVAQGLRQKSEKFSQFLGSKVDSVYEEFFSIKEKCQDLRQTNFDLGMRHLENGSLPEAIFRFRFIKKFWPTYLEAQYQLAYCLVLNEKSQEAKKILEELLKKDPNFNPIAQELLTHLNQISEDAKNS